jgi:hypothetical protein
MTQKVEWETTALTCDGSGHAFHQAIRLAVAGKVIQVILVTVAAIPSGRSQEPDVIRAENGRSWHADKHLTSGRNYKRHQLINLVFNNAQLNFSQQQNNIVTFQYIG